MMDFLRRLAPAGETDATRAVAVLPSRYASKSPLLATVSQELGHDQPDQSHDDGVRYAPDAASPLATHNTEAAQGHRVTSSHPSQTTARPLAGEPSRFDNERVISSAYTPAEAPRTHPADLGELQYRQAKNLQRDKLTTPKQQGLASTPAAPYTLHNVTAPPAAAHPLHQSSAPPAQARVTLPLSQAAIAQLRTLQSRDESPIVHVTIGRIDVVASTTPAPAATRSPPPRQATVTLADYLRNGSHR